MIKEAIILAGGMGTRLKSVITDIPKPMAPVANRPFLEIILDNLKDQGVEHIVLAVGYKYEVIAEYFGNTYKDIEIDYAIEEEPLGTGGAVSFAMEKIKEDSFLMLNGDTLFDVDLNKFCSFHEHHKSDLSIALKTVSNQDRYGLVEIDSNNRVSKFLEKQFISEGLINGGIYATSSSFIKSLSLPMKYSWEKEVLELQIKESRIYGYSTNSYFIDIGIPQDYSKAQIELG